MYPHTLAYICILKSISCVSVYCVSPYLCRSCKVLSMSRCVCVLCLRVFVHVCVYFSLQHTATHCNTWVGMSMFCVCVYSSMFVSISHISHCNTLQHTATHCNTLQNTATHCNTLQHTATHGNTLQHTATHYTNCNTFRPHWFWYLHSHCLIWYLSRCNSACNNCCSSCCSTGSLHGAARKGVAASVFQSIV